MKIAICLLRNDLRVLDNEVDDELFYSQEGGRLGSATVKYKDFTVQESLTIFSVTMQLSSPGCCISV